MLYGIKIPSRCGYTGGYCMLIELTTKEFYEGSQTISSCLQELKIRKLQCSGHVMRGTRYNLQVSTQGKIIGKRSIGRRRISWLQSLRDWYKP